MMAHETAVAFGYLTFNRFTKLQKYSIITYWTIRRKEVIISLIVSLKWPVRYLIPAV